MDPCPIPLSLRSLLLKWSNCSDKCCWRCSSNIVLCPDCLFKHTLRNYDHLASDSTLEKQECSGNGSLLTFFTGDLKHCYNLLRLLEDVWWMQFCDNPPSMCDYGFPRCKLWSCFCTRILTFISMSRPRVSSWICHSCLNNQCRTLA